MPTEIAGISIPFLNSFSFWGWFGYPVAVIGLAIVGFMMYRRKKFKKYVIAKILLVSDRSGTRKVNMDLVISKAINSRSQEYFRTAKTGIMVKRFPRESILVGKGGDLWIGYVDKNNFIHPMSVATSYPILTKDANGKIKIENKPTFTTINEDLSDFFIRASEDNIEKNYKPQKWEKYMPAAIIGAGMLVTLMIIIAISVLG